MDKIKEIIAESGKRYKIKGYDCPKEGEIFLPTNFRGQEIQQAGVDFENKRYILEQIPEAEPMPIPVSDKPYFADAEIGDEVIDIKKMKRERIIAFAFDTGSYSIITTSCTSYTKAGKYLLSDNIQRLFYYDHYLQFKDKLDNLFGAYEKPKKKVMVKKMTPLQVEFEINLNELEAYIFGLGGSGMKLKTTLEKIGSKFKELKGYTITAGNTMILISNKTHTFSLVIALDKRKLMKFEIELFKQGIKNNIKNNFLCIITDKDYLEIFELIESKRFKLLQEYCKASHKKYKLL